MAEKQGFYMMLYNKQPLEGSKSKNMDKARRDVLLHVEFNM